MLAFDSMVHVTYGVPRIAKGWELPEETMPESTVHGAQARLLESIFVQWAKGKDVLVGRNLAVRWSEPMPKVGVDPDVSVFAPSPPLEEVPGGGRDLRSVRTWLPGHAAPRLAIEIVSTTKPRKDYRLAPEKYAASGTKELWIFDPLLAGPAIGGGPYVLQVWRRQPGGFVREHAGDGSVFSEALGAWAVVMEDSACAETGAPRVLRVAAHEDGNAPWPTEGEAERAAKDAAIATTEAERIAKEAEREARAAAEERVRELEALLARRSE